MLNRAMKRAKKFGKMIVEKAEIVCLALGVGVVLSVPASATTYIDFSLESGFADAKDTLLSYAGALVGVLLLIMGLRKLNRYLSRS